MDGFLAIGAGQVDSTAIWSQHAPIKVYKSTSQKNLCYTNPATLSST